MSLTSAMKPLVSICMPTYNYGQYIELAVRSAFEQDYRPLELVIVDDGSTDNTWDVLARLQAKAPFTMKVIKGLHRGVSAALNLAVAAANGEWVSVFAADDISRSDRVSKQIAATTEDVLLVHSEYTCIDEYGTPSAYDSTTDLPPASGRDLRDLLLLRSDVRSMTVMIRRSGLREHQPYDEHLPAEDWQSILRLAKAGLISHVPEQLVYRRVHSASASFTSHRKKKTFSMQEIGVDVLREVCPPELSFDRVGVLHASVVIRNAVAIGAWEKVADGLRQCWRAFPSERALLVASCSSGLVSYAWVNGMRARTPPAALKLLLRLKAMALKARYR